MRKTLLAGLMSLGMLFSFAACNPATSSEVAERESVVESRLQDDLTDAQSDYRDDIDDAQSRFLDDENKAESERARTESRAESKAEEELEDARNDDGVLDRAEDALDRAGETVEDGAERAGEAIQDGVSRVVSDVRN